MQRRRIIVGKFHGRAFVGMCEGVEALSFLLPLPVDDQMPGDGKEPGLELGPAVVLMTAFQHADPGLLEKILGAFAVAGDVEKIAEQPVLILLDEGVEQFRVAAFQAQGQGLGVVGHECRKQQGSRPGEGRSCNRPGKGRTYKCRAHSKLYTSQAGKKTHAPEHPGRSHSRLASPSGVARDGSRKPSQPKGRPNMASVYPIPEDQGSVVLLWAGEDPALHSTLLEQLESAEIRYSDKTLGDDEVAPSADPLPIDFKPRFGFEVAVLSGDLPASQAILEKLLDEEPADLEIPAQDETPGG